MYRKHDPHDDDGDDGGNSDYDYDCGVFSDGDDRMTQRGVE